jgi:acetolactate synthase-1/2/3 large subunit
MTTVADVVVDGLARAGAPRLFAVAAATALLAAAGRRGLEVVPARTNAAACVMGAVTGRLAEAPGAAVIAGDPASARDGVASAFLGRCPVVVVTGGAEAPARVESLNAVTKATLPVGRESAAHWIAHACQLAMTEPWGPVRLHVADDVAQASALPVATACRPAPLAPPDPEALDAAARLIGGAARPLLVVGLQCRSESDAAWLRAFAEALPAPALVTPHAKGALPDPHPLVIGTLGAHASEAALVDQADLVIAVGLDPLEARPGVWPARLPVLHLGAAAPETTATAAVVGEIGLVLEELAPRLRERRAADWDVARLHALKQAMGAAPSPGDPGRAAYGLVERSRAVTPAGTLAVFDADDALSAAPRAWQAVAPGECVVSAGHGVGFALPAAIAGRLARPHRPTMAFTTRRLLAAAVDELDTVVALGLPIVVVVVDDGAPSPLALARRAGLTALQVDGAASFEAAVAGALARGEPTVLDSRV